MLQKELPSGVLGRSDGEPLPLALQGVVGYQRADEQDRHVEVNRSKVAERI